MMVQVALFAQLVMRVLSAPCVTKDIFLKHVLNVMLAILCRLEFVAPVLVLVLIVHYAQLLLSAKRVWLVMKAPLALLVQSATMLQFQETLYALHA
jgi:hypothetical protein